MTVYLDCNATTPIDPEVLEVAIHYMRDEFGNAGSRTHEFGVRAKRAVDLARRQVADAAAARPEEVIFTSGATESNNLALLGVARASDRSKRHIISSGIEHKAVLEPLEQLAKEGFEIELLPCDERGWIDPDELGRALREDTLMVSMMHVNNETGVIQPLEDYSQVLAKHEAFFHVDSAQGFGKDLERPRDHRIDLLSISGHKLFAPKGIGALIARRRGRKKIPIEPLIIGGGQERGLRAGTQPVHLIASIGKATLLALHAHSARSRQCDGLLQGLKAAMKGYRVQVNGDEQRLLGNCVNLSFAGTDTEALLLAMKRTLAFSNGSACTSSSYETSHVLKWMKLTEERQQTACRFSWSHQTELPHWDSVFIAARTLAGGGAPVDAVGSTHRG